MKESFKNNTNTQPAHSETLKIADDTGEMFEWEVSHTDAETGMVFLKHYDNVGDEAKFIYRGMSRARYGELMAESTGQNITTKDVSDQSGEAYQAAATMGERESDDVQSQSNAAEEAENIAARRYTVREVHQLFSYVDINGKENMDKEWMLTDPTAKVYTAELTALSAEYGQGAIRQLSDEIRADYKNVMEKLRFTPGEYTVGESESWSMWDIAKQSYLAKHPEESNSNYNLVSPLDPEHREEKIREISSRHIGWEFQSAMNSRGKKSLHRLSDNEKLSPEGIAKEQDARSRFIADSVSAETAQQITELMQAHEPPMPAYALTKLGELLRTETESEDNAPEQGSKKLDLPQSFDEVRNMHDHSIEDLLEKVGDLSEIKG